MNFPLFPLFSSCLTHSSCADHLARRQQEWKREEITSHSEMERKKQSEGDDGDEDVDDIRETEAGTDSDGQL